jgi:hypothetical protein
MRRKLTKAIGKQHVQFLILHVILANLTVIYINVNHNEVERSGDGSMQRHYRRLILLLMLLYCYMFRSYSTVS